MIKLCVICGKPFETRWPQSKACPGECGKARNARACSAWKKNNRDRWNALKRRWYHANSEKCLQRTREWCSANPGKVRATHSVWQKANAEHVKLKAREWRKLNSTRLKESNRSYRNVNREKLNAARAAFYKSNPDKKVRSLNRVRVWRNSNRGPTHATRQFLQMFTVVNQPSKNEKRNTENSATV